MTCSRPNCDNVAHRNRLCHKHYDVDSARGYVNANIVRARIEQLHRDGMSWMAIAKAANLTEQGVYYLRDKATVTQSATARRIFAVDVSSRTARLDPIGTQRRIQALMRLGWPQTEISRLAGCAQRRVSEILQSKTITGRTIYAIRVAYDQLSMKPGPSNRVRIYAERRGWPPPLAWDDDTIDDPNAKPIVARRPATFTERYTELIKLGERNEERIAQRLGMNVDSMTDQCYRHGLGRVS